MVNPCKEERVMRHFAVVLALAVAAWTQAMASEPPHQRHVRMTLVSLLLLFLSAGPVVAADSTHPAKDASPAATDDNGKQAEPAECPIKKTIDGKTYCFQNDPALTKRQGGS
jgi:hypothetical protein